MESRISAEITDSKVHSHSCKPSSLEKITALECKKLETSKSDSATKAENPLNSVSCLSSCLKSSKDTKITDGGGDLGPITLFLDRETMDISSTSDQTEDLEMLPQCQTPTKSIFDPFAPGPEDLVFAPKKKMLKGTKIPLRRQLNFDLCIDSEEKVESAILDEEDLFVETVCKYFLELIVSNQVMEISDENSVEEDNPSKGMTTPTSIPFLTGIAVTCPAAPMRPILKSRRLNQSICQKLEFGNDLN